MTAALPLAEARARVRETLAALARHSSRGAGTTRLAFSPEFDAARDLVLAPLVGDPDVEVRADACDNCPTGMFFVPSLGGVSHAPLEASRPEDVALALDLLAGTAATESPRGWRPAVVQAGERR